jgi:hypothetical protein
VSDDRRALKELARLYGVQESYKDVFGKRVPAGVDSTIAVLRAMDAPVSSLRDAPEALRARKEEPARPPARAPSRLGKRSSPDARSSP